nr:SBBP repeat-containing protein [Pseudomonadota bacterium]
MRIKIIAFLTSLTLFGCASSISTGELNFPTKENKISYEKVNQTKLPFIANNGQLDTKVKFYARTFAGTVYVTDNELVYDLPKLEKDKTVSKQGVSFKETFVNTDLERLNPQAGKQSNATYSSFIGKDKSKWTSGNTTYQSVSIGEPWEGIKLELFAHGNNVEKIFTVMPGIEPSKISLAFEGTEDFKIDNQTGEMIVKTDLGEVKFTKPIAYQMSKGEKIPVQVSYHIEHNKYGFTVGDYDHSRELIIDPLLGSTYLGGSNTDYLLGIAVDSSGNAYVTGYTISSSDFPTTSGAYDRTYNTNTDTFVSKLSSDLTTLVASTFIGGTSGDYASRIAIDTTDNVYIAGNTNSSDYPVTSGAYSETATASSGFISKFNSSLTTLLASTFIPSDTSINLNQLTVDAAGDVFVVGSTNSSNYPTTTGVYDRTANGGQDAYISKFNSSLTTLIASTLIGGASTDNGSGIAFDSTGNIYLLGFTNGSDYPTTSDGYDISHNGDNDVFISKFNSTLTSLLKSTFLGGSAAEVNGKISIDSSDSVFVVSSTDSSDFPTTAGAYDRSHNGSSDIAISKLNSSLTTLAASTFIGTTADDIAYSMALD